MEDDFDDAAMSAAFDAAAQPIRTARMDAPRRPMQQDDSARVVQPKPRMIEKRTGPSSILVSPRQKGNPVLASIRALPWEYSDIPADFVLGQTTCALFLSLKYHKLHPEYIYSRIRNLQGKYGLRIILTLVDISNHEEPLRELSKTSIINEVTVVLCWSAQEAGRYLELYKSFEGAAPTSIRSHQSNSYSDRLVDFITTPRSINKADAVALVSTFGSIRTAVNARPEEMSLVQGWGDIKVQRWCNAVREPFRTKRAARRILTREDTNLPADDLDVSMDPATATRLGISVTMPANLADEARRAAQSTAAADRGPDEDEEMAMAEAVTDSARPATTPATATPATAAKRKVVSGEADLDEGIAAHLARLRGGGG